MLRRNKTMRTQMTFLEAGFGHNSYRLYDKLNVNEQHFVTGLNRMVRYGQIKVRKGVLNRKNILFVWNLIC